MSGGNRDSHELHELCQATLVYTTIEVPRAILPQSVISELNYIQSISMRSIIGFGEVVAGYDVPVLNEREIRAAAGILFLATFTSFMFILFQENFVPIKYVIVLFLSDFIIRVFVNPKYAPTLILARLIVRNQVPEYTGAPQKKFAWIIGVVLSAVMFVHLVVLNAIGPIAGITCLICMAFLYFEAVFGICLGCKFYPLFFKKKVEYCPGGVCEVHEQQEVQKISAAQLLIVAVTVIGLLVVGSQFNHTFAQAPSDPFGVSK